jgi:hypothetical protein
MRASSPRHLDLGSHRTSRGGAKFWIDPQDRVIPLLSLHYEFFRDRATAERCNVPFSGEIATRLAALRVGFVRGNYELNGGLLVLESMRHDRALRTLVDEIVLSNRDALDQVRMTILDAEGSAVHGGAVSLLELRQHQRAINRWSLGSWNNFPRVEAPGRVA